MADKLTKKDYIEILNFYKIGIPRSSRLLQKKAENIMAEKLCKCIKSVDVRNEPKSIGICTRSVFNSKGYTRGKFKCRDKRKVSFRKTLKFRDKRKTRRS
jgi:hypothetical protein